MIGGVLEPWHLIVILVIVLVIFGPGKLPEIGGALGKGIRDFKSSAKDLTDSANEVRDVFQETRLSSPADQLPPSAKSDLSINSRVCPKCSSLNPIANRFCGNCGAEVTAV